MVTPLHSVTDPNPTAVLMTDARGVQYCCKPHTEDSHPGVAVKRTEEESLQKVSLKSAQTGLRLVHV